MLTLLLGAGFLAGILFCLLLLKLLPVKLVFNWGSSVGGVAGKFRKIHPKYCRRCDSVPCIDKFQHKFE